MPVNINNISYLSASEVIEDLEVTRQTLWRWRQEGKIPAGHRLRDRKVVFSPDEVDEIRVFANQVEPIGLGAEARTQLNLFEKTSVTEGDR